MSSCGEFQGSNAILGDIRNPDQYIDRTGNKELYLIIKVTQDSESACQIRNDYTNEHQMKRRNKKLCYGRKMGEASQSKRNWNGTSID